jgi:hypothetical protein
MRTPARALCLSHNQSICENVMKAKRASKKQIRCQQLALPHRRELLLL